MIRTWVDDFQETLHEMDPFLTLGDPNQTLTKELRFLKLFICCFVNWSYAVEDDWPHVAKLLKAQYCLNCLNGIVHSIEAIIGNWDCLLFQKLDHLSFEFVGKVQCFKPVLKEVCLHFSDLSVECKSPSKHDIREVIALAIKNLKDLPVLKPDMTAPAKKKIGAVEKRLEFVYAIFHFASRDQQVDELNSFFNHLEDWAICAAGVPFLYWVDEIDERVDTMVSRLIQKFKPCTLKLAELYLGALKVLKPLEEPDFALEQMAEARLRDILLEDLVLPIDDGFEMLQEGLIFFISLVMNPPLEYAEEGKLICANDAASWICSLYAGNLKLKEVFLDFSDLWLECKPPSKDDIPELIDLAVKNLKDLPVLKPGMTARAQKQIGAVEKRLGFVSAIFHFASRGQRVDQLNSFFNHLEDWAISAARVPFLYWADEIGERVNTIVSHLIQKFKPCTLELAELYLGALKALKPSEEPDFAMKRMAVEHFLDILLEDLDLPIGDGLEMFQEGLIVFVSFLLNPPQEYVEEGNLISTQSNLCVNEAASLICTLYTSNLKEDVTSGSLHDFVEKMNRAKTEIREVHLGIPASSWNNFPRTNVHGFLDSFMEDLKEKLKCETALTTHEKHRIMIVQKELLSLKPFLKGLFELQDENEEFKDLWTQISRVAYRAEYVIDSCFFFDATYWCNMMHLSNVIEEVQFIKIELNKSKDIHMCNMRVVGDKMNSSGILPAQANNDRMDDVVVGFANEEKEIIDSLIGGSSQLDIVAIVGMPGQGKTTLAKKVYHDHHVKLHFQKYAWCCISQAYKIKDILIDILKDVNSYLTEDVTSDKTQEDLAEELYRCLKGRTYLIVLDDVWNIGAWDELKASFPDDNNGSRIMFTSRIHTVALEAKPNCSFHELRPLSLEDSWKLLQLKLSYENGCPPNLSDIGKQIAEKCKGLPLAVVTVAGLLAEADGNLAFWKKISQNINSQIAREGCMDILELSYKHLPDHLKPCFLYLGVFQEDQEISTQGLTQLWISEGFVQKQGPKSLEDVANEYLMDLVGRSLLFVAKRSSTYGIKWCQVHDLVRELCLEKAKEENFLLVPNISDDHSFDAMHDWYRLCFHTDYWPSFESEPTASAVRTLLFWQSAMHADASSFLIWFKFLRVLHLGKVVIGSEIDPITQLVHLRFLALYGAFKVPSSIANLSRLEVFRLIADITVTDPTSLLQKNFPFGRVLLPETMWKMRSLRHLYFYGVELEVIDDDVVEEFLQLDNLQTLRLSGYSITGDLKGLLRRIPNVRKLCVSLSCSFQALGFLSKLESLNLTLCETLVHFDWKGSLMKLPSTLRKLKLRGVPSLSASVISAIGTLPNLEVLKLEARFEGQRWDVGDEEFLNLKYLKLWSEDIEQWNVSTDSFPQLQQLLLRECYNLEEISYRFGEVSTLKVIKVFGWRKLSVPNSFHDIVAEQLDGGNVGLQFSICHYLYSSNDDDRYF